VSNLRLNVDECSDGGDIAFEINGCNGDRGAVGARNGNGFDAVGGEEGLDVGERVCGFVLP